MLVRRRLVFEIGHRSPWHTSAVTTDTRVSICVHELRSQNAPFSSCATPKSPKKNRAQARDSPASRPKRAICTSPKRVPAPELSLQRRGGIGDLQIGLFLAAAGGWNGALAREKKCVLFNKHDVNSLGTAAGLGCVPHGGGGAWGRCCAGQGLSPLEFEAPTGRD